jgi:DNA-binding transcriptional MerR regulator
MPYKEKHIEKEHWTAPEISYELKINLSQISFWEQELPLFFSKKKINKIRRYTKRDREIIFDIHRLRNVKKTHTMKGVEEYLHFKYNK